MMLPFWKVDKDSNPNLDTKMLLYHHSYTLQHRLEELGVERPTVYNLATPLQMISDTYLYVRYFIGAPPPAIIVLGVTPRDFYDHDFQSPSKTLNFSCRIGLTNCPSARLFLPNWQDKADFLISRLCFVYDKRSFMLNAIEARMAKYGREKAEMPVTDRTLFSIDQYKRRYRGIGEASLSTQSEFLKRLAIVCRQKHSKLIVVNMPIPRPNRALLPAKFYDHYRDLIRNVTAEQGATFVDLADCPEFIAADFDDSIHLNASGGKKLIRHIADAVCHAISFTAGCIDLQSSG